MRKTVVAAVVAALMATGCHGWPSSAEDAEFKQYFTSLGELWDALGAVKTDADLKAAKPRLDELAARVGELHGKVKALPDAKRKRLFERHKELVDAAKKKHFEQLSRQMKGDLPGGAMTYMMVVAEEVKP